MPIILGLDIATTTGYAILINSKLVSYGKISLNSKDTYEERFKYFRKETNKLIKTYKPNIVSIEQTYVGPNPKTTAYLNMLRGICIETVPLKVKIVSENVTRIRKQVLGQGKKHDKNEVFKYVTCKYGLSTLDMKKDLDISDAILLCIWADDIEVDN